MKTPGDGLIRLGKTLALIFSLLIYVKVNDYVRLNYVLLISLPRVWYRDTGHFIGFFSQPRLWRMPSVKSVPPTPVRPYDISEVSHV